MNECIFCKIMKNELPSYTLYEDNDIKVFMDVNPNSNGHILIVTKKHIDNFLTIDDETLLKVNNVAKLMQKKINDILKPDGLKLVTNYGSEQLVKHYHLHIIPIYLEKEILLPIEDVYNKLNNG